MAVDSVGAGVGETVFFVRGKEASFPFYPTEVPADAGIVGIVDHWDVEGSGCGQISWQAASVGRAPWSRGRDRVATAQEVRRRKAVARAAADAGRQAARAGAAGGGRLGAGVHEKVLIVMEGRAAGEALGKKGWRRWMPRSSASWTRWTCLNDSPRSRGRSRGDRSSGAPRAVAADRSSGRAVPSSHCSPVACRGGRSRRPVHHRARRHVQSLRLLHVDGTLTQSIEAMRMWKSHCGLRLHQDPSSALQLTKPPVLLTRSPASAVAPPRGGLRRRSCIDGDAPRRDEPWSRASPASRPLSLVTDTVDRRCVDAGTDLKVVANVAVGYNNIDVAAARAKGVIVTNTPGRADRRDRRPDRGR